MLPTAAPRRIKIEFEGGTLIVRALSKLANSISGSETAAMKRKAQEIEKESGRKVIHLVVGEPDFDTPAYIKDAAMKALFEKRATHYTPAQGLPELREAIATWENAANDIECDWKNEVVVTNGSYQALFLSLAVVLDEGEEVILLDPSFGPYKNLVRLAGGTAVYTSTKPIGNHYAITAEDIEKVITPRTKVILLNTPGNPTGSVMTKDELLEILSVATKHDLYIIVDEIYSRIIFDGHQHVSIASLSEDARNRTITVNGFSKTFAMTGWRLAYMIANKEICAAATRLNHHTGRCATTFVQWAGVAALTGPSGPVEEMVAAYASRRRLMVEGIARISGLTCIRPEGTFYLMVDHTASGKTSKEMADYLLNEAAVAVTPGDYYGPAGEGYMRLSFATSDANIKEAIVRMSDALAKLI